MQMMLGMILRDARYDGHVTIIPLYIKQIMEFTKKEVKELDWPRCGPRSRIDSDGEMLEVVAESSEDDSDVGSDVEMAEVVDPLGNKASDAAKLFPDLAGSECSAAAISVTREQLSADETDVDNDDSVVPEAVKKWPRDVPKPQHPLTIVTSTIHLIQYYSFDPEPGDLPDEDVPGNRFQGKLKNHDDNPPTSTFIFNEQNLTCTSTSQPDCSVGSLDTV